MAKICILSALLLQLLYTSIQGQNSPCPDRFTYIKKPGSDETIGLIQIRNPPHNPTNYFVFHLKVDLKVATQVSTSYDGEVDLTKSKEDAIRDVLEGKPLLYYIRFPVQNPLPTVHRIWFNNEQICAGPEISGNVVTTISLENNLESTIHSAQNQLNLPLQNRPDPFQPFDSFFDSDGIDSNIFLHSNNPVSQYSDSSFFSQTALSRNTNNFISNPISQYSDSPFFSQTALSRNTNNYINNPFFRPNAPRLTQAPQSVNNNDNFHTEFIRPSNPNSGGNPFLSSFTPRSPQQAPQSTPRPSLRPTSAPVDMIENYNECGISGNRGSPNLLIAHGNETSRGQWPWVAAIFQLKQNYYTYICGGTILTTKHVLTAGHCLKPHDSNNETIPANTLSVALGRHKLMDFNEQGSVTVGVARHISHPEYTHTATADSDLAILILKSPVEFTAFIKPICLWSPSVDSHRFDQKDGIVVGWGEDEHGNRYTEEPRLAIMPIVKAEICLRSNPIFSIITSERTFCASGRNISGPCNGDSGSGLVIFDSITGRYQLRGIVSRAPRGNQPFCDQTQYIVFADVFKYLNWINQQKDST